jgi:hypothetical protein
MAAGCAFRYAELKEPPTTWIRYLKPLTKVTSRRPAQRLRATLKRHTLRFQTEVQEVVTSRIFTSWDQMSSWLIQLDGLHRAAY